MDSVPNTQEGAEGTPEPAPKPAGDGNAGEAKFTQADLDRYAGRARMEERQKYPDYAKLKEELEASRREKLTKEEKLTADLAESERNRADSDERIATALIDSEVKVAAVQAGVINPSAAVLMIDRSGLSYSEEDGVKGVAEAVTALLEAEPYLKGPGGPAQAPNLNPGGKAPAADVGLSQDQRDAAHIMFSGMTPAEAEAEYKKGLS